MNSSLFTDDKGREKDINSMMDRISGWIDREYDEFQIYYTKGMTGRFLSKLEIRNNPYYARGALPAVRSFKERS